jgi:AraC family transcriptional regulator
MAFVAGPNTTHWREVEGIVVSAARYAPGLRMARHDHGLAAVSVVTTGGYAETAYDGERDVDASLAVFRPAGSWHAVSFGGAAHCRIVNLTLGPGVLEALRPRGLALDEPVVTTGTAAGWLARRLEDEIALPDASELALYGVALEILGELGRPRRRDAALPKWLADARDLLHARFRDELSLAEVARDVGVHPVHFARSFRARHGCTAGEYVRRLRLEFARRELATTDRSVAEIAHAAGFADQSHFARLFRRATGASPREYRARSRR